MSPEIMQYIPWALLIAAVLFLVMQTKKSAPAAPKVETPPHPVPGDEAKPKEPEVYAVEPPTEIEHVKSILVAVGVKGAEQLDIVAKVRRHELTVKDVIDAHKKD